MEIQELREEAKKHGYNLSKKITYERIQPCSCGSRRNVYQEISINPRGKYFFCKNCGLKGEISKTLYGAIHNWNVAVEDRLKVIENIDKF